MPARFKIFPEQHLIFTRYYDTVVIDDYVNVVEGVIAHPDFDIHYTHLIDLTHLKKIKRDYLKVMMVQARLADLVVRSRSDILNVVIAPTPVALSAANMALKSWDRLDTKIVGRIVTNYNEAASLLACQNNKLLSLRDEILL